VPKRAATDKAEEAPKKKAKAETTETQKEDAEPEEKPRRGRTEKAGRKAGDEERSRTREARVNSQPPKSPEEAKVPAIPSDPDRTRNYFVSAYNKRREERAAKAEAEKKAKDAADVLRMARQPLHKRQKRLAKQNQKQQMMRR